MNQSFLMNRAIVVAFLLVLPLMIPVVSSAAEPEKGTRALQDLGLQQIAVESVQDTLNLCLSRIPADGSVGQLMLAKQNCHQIDVERQKKHLTF